MTLEPLGQAVTISYFFRGKQSVSLINMFLKVSDKKVQTNESKNKIRNNS